ncbi:YqgE/AlgH family protein [Vogesella indigofera]|uniref:YqgE/AlgH family protein n=1 Tax=Vogesella indigofera TaxID=45465 RepID=UPI003F429D67
MNTLTLAHHFLIAMPSMTDPLFAKSIVYICEHGDQGAMGMIINKPSGLVLAQLLEQIDLPLANDEANTVPVHFGGPVQPDRGFVLHMPIGNWQSTLTITDDMALTTSKDILQAVSEAQGPDKLLVSLGYSGWEKGQLEEEIAANQWLTVAAADWVIFDTPSEARFDSAIKLLGFDPALLCTDAGHA